MTRKISIKNLGAWFGSKQVLKNINLEIEPFRVTALIGPSGCGKSTFVRCLNRMHEVVPGAKMEGEVWVADENIYAPHVDPVLVRRRIGMVFQRPNPFPTLSIYENVIAGLKWWGPQPKDVG
jgi:phosphate transport system ATP-binding protein